LLVFDLIMSLLQYYEETFVRPGLLTFSRGLPRFPAAHGARGASPERVREVMGHDRQTTHAFPGLVRW
jgi:hypothetical protein